MLASNHMQRTKGFLGSPGPWNNKKVCTRTAHHCISLEGEADLVQVLQQLDPLLVLDVLDIC